MTVTDPKFKRLRAMKLVEGKVMHNKTNKQLAKDFNVSLDTIERTLTWASRANIFAKYEDKIVEELIPLAHTAIRDALLDGNAKVALEVFKGLSLLRTGQTTAPAQKQADEDLAAYIAAKRDQATLLEANTFDVRPLEGHEDVQTATALLAEGSLGDSAEDPAPGPDALSTAEDGLDGSEAALALDAELAPADPPRDRSQRVVYQP